MNYSTTMKFNDPRRTSLYPDKAYKRDHCLSRQCVFDGHAMEWSNTSLYLPTVYIRPYQPCLARVRRLHLHQAQSIKIISTARPALAGTLPTSFLHLYLISS